jgi:hypothetical protein
MFVKSDELALCGLSLGETTPLLAQRTSTAQIVHQSKYMVAEG